MQKEIYKKLAHILSFICNNPLLFVSETDIHVLVMNELMKISCLDPFKNLYKTNVSIGRNKKGTVSEHKYCTMLAHKEYGHNTKIGERSDIAIFDPCDTENIDDPINLIFNQEYLSPRFIFEFGTEKAAQTVGIYKKHLLKDFLKVSKSKDKGFIIHIQRRFVRAGQKSMRLIKNQLKLQDYEKATIEFWRNKRNNKVIPLIFSIEIGVKERNIGSKVKFFDPYRIEWKRINLKSIENEIIRILTEGDKSGN
jgi:hypothetical protein